MKSRRKAARILSEILDWSKAILGAFAAVFVISHTLIANAQVPTGSMETTIMTGSRIIINRLAYISSQPQRGDIIAFYFPDDGKTVYLKRVIGQPLTEDYIREEISEDFGPYIIPEGSFFMMGDNRNNSLDSRYWEDKYVEKDEIVGRAEIEYFPELKWL